MELHWLPRGQARASDWETEGVCSPPQYCTRHSPVSPGRSLVGYTDGEAGGYRRSRPTHTHTQFSPGFWRLGVNWSPIMFGGARNYLCSKKSTMQNMLEEKASVHLTEDTLSQYLATNKTTSPALSIHFCLPFRVLDCVYVHPFFFFPCSSDQNAVIASK